jgi:hypothetical protein
MQHPAVAVCSMAVQVARQYGGHNLWDCPMMGTNIHVLCVTTMWAAWVEAGRVVQCS